MSDNSSRDEALANAFIAGAVVVGILAVCALLYGMFVYNHSQDVSRDKFLIQNCKGQVQSDTSALSNGKVFDCGGLKK